MQVYPQSITDQKTIFESAGYPAYTDGSYHGGIDTVHGNHLAYAPESGTVVAAHTWQGGTTGIDSWGNYIVVDMGSSTYWLAAHFAAQTHSVGEQITKGDLIGTQGRTGNVTGVHTHWEYWVGGQSTKYRQDPATLLGIPNGRGIYQVSWDASGPAPDPGPSPSPGKLKLPVWLLFKMSQGR